MKILTDGLPPVQTVKSLPLLVPEETLQQLAEKKRAKRGLLGGSEERYVFERIVYLPYLQFSYRYAAEKGLVSKQQVIQEGKSAVLALKEVDLGFQPELLDLAPQLMEIDLDPKGFLAEADPTGLLSEKLEGLRRLLADHDEQIQVLSQHSLDNSADSSVKQSLKEHLEYVKKQRVFRWKLFSDGLRLPSKIDLDTFEFLEADQFYIPYFIVKLSRGREYRYLVWNRAGKEDETIADELMKNRRFRELLGLRPAAKARVETVLSTIV